jgi:hypothetical protein
MPGTLVKTQTCDKTQHNPYLTAAVPRALGERRAEHDAERSDVARGLAAVRVRARLAQLQRVPVAIEVRVLDDYSPDHFRPPVHATLCRADYHADPDALFALLQASLPFAEWDKAEVVANGPDADPPRLLFPTKNPTWMRPPVDFTKDGARRDSFLQQEILEIFDMDDLLVRDGEDVDESWTRTSWTVTLTRLP